MPAAPVDAEPVSDIREVRQSSEVLDQRDRGAVIRRLLARVAAPTVFDVGAGVGATLEQYFGLFPNARAHAFEAHPERSRLLRKKFATQPQVRLNEVAVYDRDGRVEFHVNRVASTSSILPTTTTGRSYMPAVDGLAGKITVPSVTLDSYCVAEGIAHIDFLKLDIQGGERAALRGASGLLGEGRISLVYAEVFFVPHYEGAVLLDELWTQLAEWGYTLYDLFLDRYGRNGQLRFGDALFVSPGIRSEVVDAYLPET